MKDVARSEGNIPLKCGLWPTSQLCTAYVGPTNGREREYDPDIILREDDVEEEAHYIGTLEDRPPPSFTTVQDIQKGFLVFVRPAEAYEELIWFRKVMK